MAHDAIKEGHEVFLSEVGKPFGAVREVMPFGRPEIVVYVENAGDFTIPLDAVESAHFQKVIVDLDRLEPPLRRAIRRAHRAEDRSI